jgi:Sec-independent protein secretion pathway component TatC
VTPTGDPLTLLALSIPLYLLYEVTILLVKLILRK